MLPTLCSLFSHVYALDLKTDLACKTVATADLKNVMLIECDMGIYQGGEVVDVIVSTDVLEHLKDLSIPLRFIDRHLAHDGHLLVSLPTENRFYQLGRKVFGVTPPPDHYHKSREILEFFCNHHYRIIQHYRYPFRAPQWITVFELAVLQKEEG